MKKQDIPSQIKSLEDQKKEIDKKINSLTIEMNNESSEAEYISIPETDLEVTKNVLYKGKSYNEIMKLKKPEEELLTLKIIGIICENPTLLKELKMDSSSTKDDFFFKQPFPQNEARGYVARFDAGSDCAILNCGGVSGISDSSLGVRFIRKKISKSKK